MKYHLFRYLYGFEEYCRSANIQFRTIHHHEPKVKEEKKLLRVWLLYVEVQAITNTLECDLICK